MYIRREKQNGAEREVSVFYLAFVTLNISDVGMVQLAGNLIFMGIGWLSEVWEDLLGLLYYSELQVPAIILLCWLFHIEKLPCYFIIIWLISSFHHPTYQ